MDKIFKADDLPQDEVIYLKKGFDGWRIVHPIKNEDGSINYFNLITGGSWYRFIMMILIVLMIIGVAYEYNINSNTCQKCLDKMNLEDTILNQTLAWNYNINNIPMINEAKESSG